VSFTLRNIPVLSRVGADRADELRTDIEAAAAGWAQALLLRVDERNQVLVVEGRVLLDPAAGFSDIPPADAVFLGRLADGRHVWAVRAPLQPPAEDGEARGFSVVDPRRTSVPFDDVSAQLVATALALLNWHERARFSPVDGSPTTMSRAGWARREPLRGGAGPPAGVAAAAVLAAGRFRRGRRILRNLRGPGGGRGDRADRG